MESKSSRFANSPAAESGQVDRLGDDIAQIEQLYVSEYRQLVGLAILLVDDRTIAEELVQDAFVALYRAASTGSTLSGPPVQILNPKGYLRRCVVNGGRDVQRRRVLSRRVEPAPMSPTEFQFAELDDVLAGLPFRQRAALVLRYVEDLPEVEIAELLDVRPTTVRTLVRRGLRQLRMSVDQ